MKRPSSWRWDVNRPITVQTTNSKHEAHAKNLKHPFDFASTFTCWETIENTETERTRHWLDDCELWEVQRRKPIKPQTTRLPTSLNTTTYYDCTFTLNDRTDNECAQQHHHWGLPTPKTRPHCRISLCIIHGKLECIIPASHQKNSNPNH